jgi:hypothetical protein
VTWHDVAFVLVHVKLTGVPAVLVSVVEDVVTPLLAVNPAVTVDPPTVTLELATEAFPEPSIFT